MPKTINNLNKNSKIADAAAFAVLLVMIIFPFALRIISQTTALSGPLSHDIGLQWVPFNIFIKRAFSEGMFPLWCPNVFAGFPFAAFSHTGVFYPLSIILHVMDYARAVNYFYPLHLFIAGSGVFTLCKRLGAGTLASFFGSVTYVFSAKPFYFIHFLPATCSNVWAPWFLWAGLCVLLSGKPIHFILTAVFLALQILGGDVESTSYEVLLFIPALFVLTRGRRVSYKRWAAFFSACFLSSMFCMVQLIPLLEYSQHFIRNQGVTFEYFTQRAMVPCRILRTFPSCCRSRRSRRDTV